MKQLGTQEYVWEHKQVISTSTGSKKYFNQAESLKQQVSPVVLSLCHSKLTGICCNALFYIYFFTF